jgi:peptide/nickel transport system substrate-binding protein
VALAIDRATINRVLLQGQGDPTGSLLPQWLSGYAFLFPNNRDVSRARQLAANTGPIAFGYDRQDPVMRAIGDRIAVNAGEAGIALRPPTGAPDVWLAVLPVTSIDALTALEDLSSLLKIPVRSDLSPYEAERVLLADFQVVPLIHRNVTWRIRPNVRNWPSLGDVWIDGLKKP